MRSIRFNNIAQRPRENHSGGIRRSRSAGRVYTVDIERFTRRYVCRRPMASRKVIILTDQSHGDIYMCVCMCVICTVIAVCAV
jgi:hypothetical protein